MSLSINCQHELCAPLCIHNFEINFHLLSRSYKLILRRQLKWWYTVNERMNWCDKYLNFAPSNVQHSRCRTVPLKGILFRDSFYTLSFTLFSLSGFLRLLASAVALSFQFKPKWLGLCFLIIIYRWSSTSAILPFLETNWSICCVGNA